MFTLISDGNVISDFHSYPFKLIGDTIEHFVGQTYVLMGTSDGVWRKGGQSWTGVALQFKSLKIQQLSCLCVSDKKN